MSEANANFRRPLQGVKIVEMATYLAGPLAAKMLADLGAEVIKVESPAGDPYRNVGPMREGTGIYWINANSGKKSVTIDLKLPEGVEAFKKLIREADIFIENSRPQVADKLGIGIEALKAVNPRLVRLSVTGYGPDGPLATEPVYDALLQGRTGLLAFEAVDGQPRGSNHFLADKVCASYVCQMAMAGLIARDRSGEGVHLQGSMLDIMSYYNFTDVLWHRSFVDDERESSVPPQVVVPTKDGFIVLSPVTGKQLSATLETLGRSEWKDELRQIKDTRERSRQFFHRIQEPLRQKTSAEWLELFRKADVPVAPVNDLDGPFKDPQIMHNDIYSVMETPLGAVRTARYPMTVNRNKLTTTSPAPALGQHNKEVL